MTEKRKAPEAQPQPRRPWTPPTVSDLPRLTQLTLQTISGEGGTAGGGSTVIG